MAKRPLPIGDRAPPIDWTDFGFTIQDIATLGRAAGLPVKGDPPTLAHRLTASFMDAGFRIDDRPPAKALTDYHSNVCKKAIALWRRSASQHNQI